jgi:adenosylcobinamide kinase/adenosylcobinamide-phosphate guanylyltransferase
LFLGGTRSGKSKLAENTAEAWQLKYAGKVVYVATAEAQDDAMAERIRLHQQRRPLSWIVLEEPRQLTQVLQNWDAPDTCILVDCLTLWLTNHLCQCVNQAEAAIAALVEQIKDLQGQLLLVSNEVGSGIVPMGALNRQFQDLSGVMNQQLAQVCDEVILAVAGLPMVLKAAAQPLVYGCEVNSCHTNELSS